MMKNFDNFKISNKLKKNTFNVNSNDSKSTQELSSMTNIASHTKISSSGSSSSSGSNSSSVSSSLSSFDTNTNFGTTKKSNSNSKSMLNTDKNFKSNTSSMSKSSFVSVPIKKCKKNNNIDLIHLKKNLKYIFYLLVKTIKFIIYKTMVLFVNFYKFCIGLFNSNFNSTTSTNRNTTNTTNTCNICKSSNSKKKCCHNSNHNPNLNPWCGMNLVASSLYGNNTINEKKCRNTHMKKSNTRSKDYKIYKNYKKKLLYPLTNSYTFSSVKKIKKTNPKIKNKLENSELLATTYKCKKNKIFIKKIKAKPNIKAKAKAKAKAKENNIADTEMMNEIYDVLNV
jgi:hypothetical protein